MFVATVWKCGFSCSIRVFPSLIRQGRFTTPSYHRALHRTSWLGVKKHVENENDYASSVLHRSLAQIPAEEFRLKTTIHSSNPPIDVDNFVESSKCAEKTPEKQLELLDGFVALVSRGSTPVDDSRFAGFVESFAESVRSFDETHIELALKLLTKLDEIKTPYEPNYVDLWMALDGECLKRVTDWDTERLLHFADLWYPLRLAKQGKFVNKALWKISNRLRKLAPRTLVKTVFYINLTRVPMENMMDIEVNFAQNFDSFSIDDVAVLCMGFFKTETPIRSTELLDKIYQTTIRHVATVEDIALTAILKLLRYSSRIPSVPSMEALLAALVPRIPSLSTFACLHVALLGSDIHLCHSPTLEPVVAKFADNLSELRLKDLERIAFVLAHNNTAFVSGKDSLLCARILEDLPNRITEIVTYPRCYISLLYFLAIRNVYNVDYITTAFDKQFLKLAYKKNLPGAGREAVSLDAYASINLRDRYDGNRFPANAFQIVCKLTQDYLPNPKYRLTKSDRMLLDIQRTFGELKPGSTQCRIVHLLPHYQRPDILFCWDALSKRLLDVNELLPEQSTHEIMTREAVLKERSKEKHLRLVAIVVGSWNCYVRNVKRRTGGYAMKLEQLRRLGYEIVEIPWYEWPVYSQDDMLKYLKAKLVAYR
ncbi:uncharacterized protein LOC125948127 [Anopheles darlingi]|uniref:uncharacterized protein LOC125948127 n=1 Tax=Anopheles darlingi TaxID=43151 RepID=UPI0021003B24|nr:uncharacterized protein LOC125948127 [Anopheles darlingi]